MLLSSLLLFMVSCESDSIENTNAVITGYKYTSTTDYPDPALPDYSRIVIGNLSNGKLFSETTEEFVNGVSQGTPTTEQHFFYSNNRLDQRVFTDDLTVYYYYDTNNNLVGATGLFFGGAYVYERYVHQSNNTIYCERIDVPYNDPAAIVSMRFILQLNSDGNIIAASTDTGLNGVGQNIHTYTYSSGNLTSMQKPDGTVVNLSYSAVIDTYSYLQELSCGKQVLLFTSAADFAGGYIQTISELRYSKNVNSQDFSTGTYLLMPDGFYNKKTTFDGSHTMETEFFFN